MTLGAIAASIGLIIDDAIVVVEQIQRTHEEHPDESSGTLVQKAIRYLFPAMVGSSISTIVIFIPFEWMSGVAGSLFQSADQYHDHYTGLFFFRYLDRVAGHLSIAVTKKKKNSQRKNAGRYM